MILVPRECQRRQIGGVWQTAVSSGSSLCLFLNNNNNNNQNQYWAHRSDALNDVWSTGIPCNRLTRNWCQNQPSLFYSQYLSATPSEFLSRMEKSFWKIVIHACWPLISSQKWDDKIIHRNFGHDFLPHSIYLMDLMPSNFYL
jgi:hypothetical protein